MARSVALECGVLWGGAGGGPRGGVRAARLLGHVGATGQEREGTVNSVKWWEMVWSFLGTRLQKGGADGRTPPGAAKAKEPPANAVESDDATCSGVAH